ncbi:MAG: transcription elongation factor GreB [Pseudobdellovibrionaceae bacterium]
MSEKNYMTPQGLAKLRAEYHQLVHVERPKVVEVVSWAAGNGDRSENADYQYGKKRLREIDKRAYVLIRRLENAEVVDPATVQSTQIVFGARVTISNEDEIIHTYQIVGEDEWDISQGRISWKSPLAKALLGKKTGDEVKIVKPAGEEYVQILKVEYK